MAFDRKEVEASFRTYVDNVLEAGQTKNWLAWVENTFTEDALYIDRGLGTSQGRAAIIAWMDSLLDSFPDVISYRLDWYVIDGDRVVAYHNDGFPDPKTGVPYECPVVTILRYAGDGRWSYEEDIYNPKELEEAMAAYLAAKAEVEKTSA